jgi:hypothetical protein
MSARTVAATSAQAAFAAALLDPARSCPGGLVAWNGSDPAARLAVHRNNVVASLVDALAETFPVVQDLVGVDFFRAMAAAFVRAHPPRTRVLMQYGEALPAFVERFAPARSVPYLADVARLEFERLRALHAADAEPLSSEEVAHALEARACAGELHLTCHPAVSIIASPYAVVSIWAAHQGAGDLATVDPQVPESALVCRPGLDVLVMRLPPGAAAFVDAVRQGLCLAESARVAAADATAFDLPAALTLLFNHGVLTSVGRPSREIP